MADDPVYVGQEGLTIAVTELGDLTGATVYYLVAFKPSGGAMVRWPAAGNATLEGTTDAAIAFTSVTGTLPDAGDYRIHAYAERGTFKGYTKMVWLHVCALGER